MAESLAKAELVAWTEVLGRSYLASAGAIVRSQQWLAGVGVTYQSGLFLPFCAALRGLIESAADTCHAFLGVPLRLAYSRVHVHAALTGTGCGNFPSSELEDALIHFSHGRKLSKPESKANPGSHQARSNRDYIDVIKKMEPSIELLYTQLCELSHPAADSVHWMNEVNPGLPWTIRFVGTGKSSACIVAILSEYRDAIVNVLQGAFNAPLVTLKVLSMFDMPELAVKGMEEICLDGIPLWHKVRQVMQ